jgi:hypothetical protein
MTFFFKVLTYPRSVPMRIIQELPSAAAARHYAKELYAGTGEGPGTWVKVYTSDPDNNWASGYRPVTPLFELPGEVQQDEAR